MKIILADDEQLQLSKLERSVQAVVPDADIHAFSDPFALTEWIDDGGWDADIAFLDIEMGPVSGIAVAKKLQSFNPKINVVFVTGFNQYATDAFELRASGYVSKPATEQKIKAEMDNLRFPMPRPTADGKKLSVRCFGYFDVTAGGEQLKFKRDKSKELLAFLIDRRGAVCTPREICAALWEEDKFDYLRQLTKDLRETLGAVGAEDVFVAHFKKYRIDPSLIDCDYYDYLSDEPYAVKAYQGDYMLQYEWAQRIIF